MHRHYVATTLPISFNSDGVLSTSSLLCFFLLVDKIFIKHQKKNGKSEQSRKSAIRNKSMVQIEYSVVQWHCEHAPDRQTDLHLRCIGEWKSVASALHKNEVNLWWCVVALPMNWIFRNIMSLAHIESATFIHKNQLTSIIRYVIMILPLDKFNHKCVAFWTNLWKLIGVKIAVFDASKEKSITVIVMCLLFVWMHRWFRSNQNILMSIWEMPATQRSSCLSLHCIASSFSEYNF